jgi:TPR repeat protein
MRTDHLSSQTAKGSSTSKLKKTRVMASSTTSAGAGSKNNTQATPITYSKELEAQAAKGDSEAQKNLGICYKNGWGIKQDFLQAFCWFEKSASQNNPYGQFLLGLCYERNWGINIYNLKQIIRERHAFSCYLKSAAQGNASGQYSLGRCYESGLGVKQDLQQAFNWYQKSAMQGDASGQYSLGRCYESGLGVKQDLQQAFDWFEKSAMQGNASGQYSLGRCYDTGQGVKQDLQQAFNWYERSAMQDDAYGQYGLGLCYEWGQGVKQDLQQAFNWYQKSAMQGNASGQYSLGLCYERGLGVKQDLQQAFNWYQKSAMQGNASGQYSLGRCYEFSRDVKQDLQQAFNWYQKSAMQGNAFGQYSLGRCYNAGKGVKQDLQQAFDWYEKAILQKNETLNQWIKKNHPKAWEKVQNKISGLSSLSPEALEQKTNSIATTSTEVALNLQKITLQQNQLQSLVSTMDVVVQKTQDQLQVHQTTIIQVQQAQNTLEEKFKYLDPSVLQAVQGNALELVSVINKEQLEQQAQGEQLHISNDKKLNDFYHVLVLKLWCTWSACCAIYSSFIKNDKKSTVEDLTETIDDLFTKHIPGLSIASGILKKIVSVIYDFEKKEAVNRISSFFSPEKAAIQIEKLARLLTLASTNDIKKINMQEQGYFQQLKKELISMKDFYKVNNVNTEIKKLAEALCEKTLVAIAKNDFGTHFVETNINTLLTKLLGSEYQIPEIPSPTPPIIISKKLDSHSPVLFHVSAEPSSTKAEKSELETERRERKALEKKLADLEKERTQEKQRLANLEKKLEKLTAEKDASVGGNTSQAYIDPNASKENQGSDRPSLHFSLSQLHEHNLRLTQLEIRSTQQEEHLGLLEHTQTQQKINITQHTQQKNLSKKNSETAFIQALNQYILEKNKEFLPRVGILTDDYKDRIQFVTDVKRCIDTEQIQELQNLLSNDNLKKFEGFFSKRLTTLGENFRNSLDNNAASSFSSNEASALVISRTGQKSG